MILLEQNYFFIQQHQKELVNKFITIIDDFNIQ